MKKQKSFIQTKSNFRTEGPFHRSIRRPEKRENPETFPAQWGFLTPLYLPSQ